MLRVVCTTFLSLSLAACSMGHVSLPFTQVAAPAKASPVQRSEQADTSRAMTGLGGPQKSQPRASDSDGPGALDLINELRFGKGLPPLTASAELTRAAQMQAANLARTGALTHIGPDGSTPIDRVRMTGFQPAMAAENIAGGQSSIVEAISSWRESDNHLRNMLLADATHMGMAQVNDPRSAMRTYWTLVLAAKR